MSDFKVGDFIKHKKAKNILFQIVDILENADEKGPGMIICNRVSELYSYLETDVSKYELTNRDRKSIIDHNL